MRCCGKRYLYFNSTIVRLKAYALDSTSPTEIDFNSTIVRLKGEELLVKL